MNCRERKIRKTSWCGYRKQKQVNYLEEGTWELCCRQWKFRKQQAKSKQLSVCCVLGKQVFSVYSEFKTIHAWPESLAICFETAVFLRFDSLTTTSIRSTTRRVKVKVKCCFFFGESKGEIAYDWCTEAKIKRKTGSESRSEKRKLQFCANRITVSFLSCAAKRRITRKSWNVKIRGLLLLIKMYHPHICDQWNEYQSSTGECCVGEIVNWITAEC